METLQLRELGPEWDERWDSLAGSSAEFGFMQSSAWARFKQTEGYLTRRVGVFDGDRLLGGASLLCFGSEESALIICPEGPVLPWADRRIALEGLRLIQRYSQEWAAEIGGLGLRIEPHLEPPAPSLLRNWSRSPVDLTPVHTLMLDLTLSDDELLAQMQPKGRYNIRLAERHGVCVRRSRDASDIDVFLGLFEDTAYRNGFFSEPRGFFLNLAASLFPTGMAELIIAEWNGEPLAAIVVIYFGCRATYLYGGSSSNNRHVMPAYAAQWAAISAAREYGCREYDLYGYDPFGLPDHLYAGISRFKRQFGGIRKDWIGARDLIFYDSLADRLTDRLVAGNQRRIM